MLEIGARVRVRIESLLLNGTFIGGSTILPSVVLDGGATIVSVPHDRIEPSNKPLRLSNLKAMKGWGVRDRIALGPIRDVGPFIATVTYRGEDAFAAFSPDAEAYEDIRLIGSATLIARFRTEISEWAELIDDASSIAISSWLDWMSLYRPYGMKLGDFVTLQYPDPCGDGNDTE